LPWSFLLLLTRRCPDQPTPPAARGNFLDEGLAIGIAHLLPNQSRLLDVGAGSGQYGAFFQDRLSRGLSAPNWTGVDGARGVEAFTETYGPPGARTRFVNLCDASAADRVGGVHDWTMTLAVGEHVPSRCLGTLLNLLHVSNRYGVIVSWDNDGRNGGTCHVSPRSEHHIAMTFGFLGGYRVDRPATNALRAMSNISWIKRTVLVLRRNASTEPEPPSLKEQWYKDRMG
jgi:hypothetical protein